MFEVAPKAGLRQEFSFGKGRVVVYGPNHRVEDLPGIIRQELSRMLPVKVSSRVQYLVNSKPNCVFVTLINNEGVTKEPREKPVVDTSKTRSAVVQYVGGRSVISVRDIKRGAIYFLGSGNQVKVQLPPGHISILEFAIK